MMRLSIIAILLLELHMEATRGWSVTGCAIRGLTGSDASACATSSIGEGE